MEMAGKIPNLMLMTDAKLCIGCHACEVACKQEFDLPVGPRWIRVVQVGPRKVGGKLRMDFVPVYCRHCGKPPCADVCPVKAITKRSDGIVLVNKELCIGCKRCLEACPFGVMQFNAKKAAAEMCNLCVHRVDKGLAPRCIQHCPTGALFFGDPNDFGKKIEDEAAKSVVPSE